MKKRTTKILVLSGLLLPPLFALRASAEDAGVAMPAATSMDASLDAGVLGDADMADSDADAGPPKPRPFDEPPLSSEKSPMPKDEEWNDEPARALTEGSWAGGCSVQRIREWIRIQCESTVAKVTLLGGNPDGVRIRLVPQREEWDQFPQGGELIFPIRPGDRRVFEWQGVEFGYRNGSSARSDFMISELWLEGDEKPSLILR